MINRNKAAFNRFIVTRRKFLKYAIATSFVSLAGVFVSKYFRFHLPETATFIASVPSYRSDLKQILRSGLAELSIAPEAFKGKRILIKPNLVEPHADLEHINTHPWLVRAVVDLFRSMDAAEVVVAEGSGHMRDSLLVLEESGMAEILYEDKIPYLDLNTGPVKKVINKGGYSKLKHLFLPQKMTQRDVLVSLAKMKTHHWAGVTLSMKNLFGLMPGCVYGWPKNVLHYAGLQQSILDINTTVRPHLSIVDGIIGMEGDGPIMGTPVQSNVLVMGTNSSSVDATCARVMGINPYKIPYLLESEYEVGPINELYIAQRGEQINIVRRDYELIPDIQAHKDIRLVKT